MVRADSSQRNPVSGRYLLITEKGVNVTENGVVQTGVLIVKRPIPPS